MQNKYEIVRSQLAAQIAEGTLPVGTKLDNEVTLAEKYGVSVITMRRALNDLVQAGVISRVRGAGTFVRQTQAAGERKKDSRLVGMLLTQESYPSLAMSRIIGSVQHTVSRCGCKALFDWNSTNPRISSESIDRMLNQQVDGFLIYPFDPSQNRAELDRISAAGKPYVLIDRRDYEKPSFYVGSDNFGGGILATEALLGLGHRKICFCAHYFFLSSERERYAGFVSAMNRNGAQLTEYSLLETVDFDLLYDWIRAGQVTAIFCCSDRLAEAACRYLKGRGLRIPEDISVCGFDDNIYSSDRPIALSTVRQDFESIGEQAVRLLLDAIDGRQQVPLSIQTGVSFVMRDSIRKAEQAGQLAAADRQKG